MRASWPMCVPIIHFPIKIRHFVGVPSPCDQHVMPAHLMKVVVRIPEPNILARDHQRVGAAQKKIVNPGVHVDVVLKPAGENSFLFFYATGVEG